MDFTIEPRLAAPPQAEGEIVILPPPELPRETPSGPLSRLLPAAMGVAVAGMMVVYFTSGASPVRNPMFMFFPVMMLVSLLGTVTTAGRGGIRAAEIRRDRLEYLDHLATVESKIIETAEQQRISLSWHCPEPPLLWTLIGGPRMWERRPTDADFGDVRIGVASVPLAIPLVMPELKPPEKSDPVTAAELTRLIRRRSLVPDQPVALPLRSFREVSADGETLAVRSLLRAVICQLALMHSPHDLRIAAVIGPLTAPEWDWLKWLPHHWHPHATDAGAPARLTYTGLSGAETSLARCGGAHIVLLVDGIVLHDGKPFCGSLDGVSVIRIDTPSEAGADLHLTVSTNQVAVRSSRGDDIFARPDAMTVAQAITFARRVCRFVPTTATSVEQHISPSSPWTELLDIDDIDTLDPAALRRPRNAMLSVPIGVSERGSTVELDIKEAAAGGMGPHGLCIGATGSGKSEFLRALTLGMITTHSSEMLNLVLVDFKGGATFLGFERAPHVAAVITNLVDEAHLVARMRDALAGEVNRRQELLRAAGNFANASDYNAARHNGAGLNPLPALFIIVDEFSELLTQHPDFIDVFIAIGRLGRSLGMHLLLASQRLDEGRLRGLDSHLSYRVCLKTFSAAESRSVLGVPDAYHLPTTPGAAFLKTGAGDPLRFQTAFVSDAYVKRPRRGLDTMSRPHIFTATPMDTVAPHIEDTSTASVASSRTVLDSVIDRLEGGGPVAHRVWLPPLTESPMLETLLERIGPARSLTVPIGLVDSPYDQRREFLAVHLAGAAGNIAVVGGPRSGKSTTLQTLLMGLAETHDPRDVQFYCLDFGGGSLSALSSLPHVGSVAGRHNTELVRRTVTQLESLLRSREAQRNSYGSGRDDGGYGEVFLVVDGWATVRQDFDALESSITTIAAQGLSYGIHVVVAATRWAEIRPALKDLIGTRIELRLGDPAESEMDRKRARQLTASPPGRGITRDGREFVIALAQPEPPAADALRSRYAGRTAPRIQVLPDRVDYDALIARCRVQRPATEVLMGIGEPDLAPLTIDFADDLNLVILGEGECGKTSVLRTLCREIVRTNTADAAQLFIVDFRRTLLGIIESEHLAAYVPSAAALTSQLAALTERLRSRTPGADVTQQQLRTRSWWSGPEIYVVVDDYDLVAPPGGANLLSSLIDFLPYAKDLGLHLVVARRSGGAARAMFDPLLARLRDVGCMGLMMSASPDEGVLLGSVRPSKLPPGRGTLVTRAKADRLVQIAWTAPA